MKPHRKQQAWQQRYGVEVIPMGDVLGAAVREADLSRPVDDTVSCPPITDPHGS